MNAIGDIVDMIVTALQVADTSTNPITYALNYQDDAVLALFRKGYLACEGQTLYTNSYLNLANSYVVTGTTITSQFNIPDLRGQFARSITQSTTPPTYVTRVSDPVVDQPSSLPLGPTPIGAIADWRYADHDHITNFDYTIDTTNYLAHYHIGANMTINVTTVTGAVNTNFSPSVYITSAGVIAGDSGSGAPATSGSTQTFLGVTPTTTFTGSTPPVITWATNYLAEIADTPGTYYAPYLSGSNVDEYAPVHAIIVKCIRFK